MIIIPIPIIQFCVPQEDKISCVGALWTVVYYPATVHSSLDSRPLRKAGLELRLLYTPVVHTSVSVLNCPYVDTVGEYVSRKVYLSLSSLHQFNVISLGLFCWNVRNCMTACRLRHCSWLCNGCVCFFLPVYRDGLWMDQSSVLLDGMLHWASWPSLCCCYVLLSSP